MKFILMVHHQETKVAQLAQAEIDRVVNGHTAYSEALSKAGVKVGDGYRLRPGAEMVRMHQADGPKGKRTLFDGPHPETKEVVGGYYILECKTREEAIDWAKQCPMWDSDVLELRPLWE